MEFSKIVGLLKPEEAEDVIISSCQKLISIIHQRPEQKQVFLSQHGFLPLMELLEVPKSRVCSITYIILRDGLFNTWFFLYPYLLLAFGLTYPSEVAFNAIFI